MYSQYPCADAIKYRVKRQHISVAKKPRQDKNEY
jgi:hypothetical protein